MPTVTTEGLIFKKRDFGEAAIKKVCYNKSMKQKSALPVITKKKMINVKQFVKLANQVRKIFEEEGKLLDPDSPNANNNTTGLYFSH